MRVAALGLLVCLGADVGYHASHGPSVEAFAQASTHILSWADHGGYHDRTHHPDHCFCAMTAANVAARGALAIPVVSAPLAEPAGARIPLTTPAPLDHPPQLAV